MWSCRGCLCMVFSHLLLNCFYELNAGGFQVLHLKVIRSWWMIQFLGQAMGHWVHLGHIPKYMQWDWLNSVVIGSMLEEDNERSSQILHELIVADFLLAPGSGIHMQPAQVEAIHIVRICKVTTSLPSPYSQRNSLTYIYFPLLICSLYFIFIIICDMYLATHPNLICAFYLLCRI